MSLQPDILSTESPLSTESSSNAAAVAWTARPLNPFRTAAITKYSGASFLDVGCGNGQYVYHFASQKHTAGVDIQAYPSWQEDPKRFQVADAANLPTEAQSYDTVLSFETLEHVPDPVAVLREFHRVSRRNVIITVPNCDVPQALRDSRLTFWHYTDRSHVNFFTKASLESMLREAGFEPQDTSLINPCATGPIIEQLLRLPSGLRQIVAGFAKRSAFPMTILAVGERR